MKVEFKKDGLAIEAETPAENAALSHAVRGGCYLPYLLKTWSDTQNAGIEYHWYPEADIPTILENVKTFNSRIQRQ